MSSVVIFATNPCSGARTPLVCWSPATKETPFGPTYSRSSKTWFLPPPSIRRCCSTSTTSRVPPPTALSRPERGATPTPGECEECPRKPGHRPLSEWRSSSVVGPGPASTKTTPVNCWSFIRSGWTEGTPKRTSSTSRGPSRAGRSGSKEAECRCVRLRRPTRTDAWFCPTPTMRRRTRSFLASSPRSRVIPHSILEFW